MRQGITDPIIPIKVNHALPLTPHRLFQILTNEDLHPPALLRPLILATKLVPHARGRVRARHGAPVRPQDAQPPTFRVALEHVLEVEEILHGKHVVLPRAEFPEEQDGELDVLDGLEGGEQRVHGLHEVLGDADLVVYAVGFGVHDGVVPLHVEAHMGDELEHGQRQNVRRVLEVGGVVLGIAQLGVQREFAAAEVALQHLGAELAVDEEEVGVQAVLLRDAVAVAEDVVAPGLVDHVGAPEAGVQFRPVGFGRVREDEVVNPVAELTWEGEEVGTQFAGVEVQEHFQFAEEHALALHREVLAAVGHERELFFVHGERDGGQGVEREEDRPGRAVQARFGSVERRDSTGPLSRSSSSGEGTQGERRETGLVAPVRE